MSESLKPGFFWCPYCQEEQYPDEVGIVACDACGATIDTYDDDEGALGDLDCTHCGGDGMCQDGIACDPLWYTGEHFCHACHGTGGRRDQVIF